jgi:hypothetical protein
MGGGNVTISILILPGYMTALFFSGCWENGRRRFGSFAYDCCVYPYSPCVAATHWTTRFLNWYSGGVESNWVHSALRPLLGLLCQPRVIMMMEKLVE